jgi:maltose/moltooligosaccharide transporter
MQSLFIGLGAVVASVLPYVMTNWFHIARGTGIPVPTRLSFYIGSAAFFGAVMWTIITTKEYPPEDLEEFRRMRAEKRGLGESASEIFDAIAKMPKTMRQLAPVQLMTWLGLFCMWLYFGVAISRSVFGATSTDSKAYSDGIEWGGNCFAMYSGVCFLFALALPTIADKLGRKNTHSLCLVCGALGLLSVGVIQDKWSLLLSMTGVGIAWASTLSMPYAVLAGSLPPKRTGVYMGIFNFFIVIPEIVASLFFGWIMNHVLHNNRTLAVVAGGCFMLMAALLMQRVLDPGEEKIKLELKEEALHPVVVK